MFDPIFEKFVRRRMFVPNGDRRYCPKSGGIVNEKDVSIRHDHVMRVLILGDHLGYNLRMNFVSGLGRRPCDHGIQAFVSFELFRDRCEG